MSFSSPQPYIYRSISFHSIPLHSPRNRGEKVHFLQTWGPSRSSASRFRCHQASKQGMRGSRPQGVSVHTSHGITTRVTHVSARLRTRGSKRHNCPRRWRHHVRTDLRLCVQTSRITCTVGVRRTKLFCSWLCCAAE